MSDELLDRVVASMGSIDLPTLQSVADLQTRFDRKYLVAPATAARVIGQLAGQLSVLEIAGQRQSRYQSVYFDTPERDSYRAAVHGRRHRFKVRTRSYLDSGGCMLEVKRVSTRGTTIKERLEYPLAARRRIEPNGREFLLDHGIGPALVDALDVSLVTDYRRTTVLGEQGYRVTIDGALCCRLPQGDSCGIGDLAVLETKSAGLPTPVDRALWRLGHRPEPISKYGTGLAALTPSLPANKWNRTLHRHFDRPRTRTSWSAPGDPMMMSRPQLAGR